MTMLNPDRARAAVIEHTRRLAEAAVAAGPDAAVPTAPGWTTTELVAHVGQTQHWVAEIIERRVTDPTRLPTEMAAVPAGPDEWTAWLTRSAQRVADACSDDALDAEVFNAAGDERTGGQFWLTSMVNEAVVHGADAAGSAGVPITIDPDVAGAIITNHLAMLTSPTWRLLRSDSADALRGTGRRLQWRASDSDDESGWSVERGPDGATWRAGVRPADVTVTGPAGSLLLLLTRRLPLAGAGAVGITVEGDAGLVRHWLDNTAHVSD